MTKSELPQSSPLSFEDAVSLFKSWGFQVELGPRPEEVTLLLVAPDYRTYCVYPICLLPQMAAVALRVRMQNGAMYEASRQLRQTGQQALGGSTTPLSVENTWRYPIT